MPISKEMPLVSILVPAYNHEKYVEGAIRSLIAQTYLNIELVVIDDGSKDGTFAKITAMKKECEKRFVRTVLLTQQNQGVCTTLNALIAEARGEYVYIIASDDMAKPDAIAELARFLDSHKDYALAVGDDEIIDSKGRRAYWNSERDLVYDEKEARWTTYKPYLEKASRMKFSSGEFGSYASLSRTNYIPNGYLVRKSIFDKTGLYTKDAPLEDWYMNLQIAKYAKMKFIDKVLMSYRWHTGNTIKNRELAIAISNKTIDYENLLVEKADLRTMTKDAADRALYGIMTKKLAIIPFAVTLYRFKRTNIKCWVLRILGIDIVFKQKTEPMDFFRR